MELLEGDIILFLFFFSPFIYIFGCLICNVSYLRESTEMIQKLIKKITNVPVLPKTKLSPKVQEAKSWTLEGATGEECIFHLHVSFVWFTWWLSLRNTIWMCHQTNACNECCRIVVSFQNQQSTTSLGRQDCSSSALPMCLFAGMLLKVGI